MILINLQSKAIKSLKMRGYQNVICNPDKERINELIKTWKRI